MIALITILRKELKRLFRVWKQAIVPPLITTLLYFIIFGQFIGSQLSSIKGFSYMQFIVPGIVMLPLITGSFNHVVFSVFFSRFQRTIDDMLVSPMSGYVIILGHVLAGMFRGMLIAVLVYLISLIFTRQTIFSLPLMLSAAVLASALFSLFGFMMGLFAKDFDDTSIVPTFILTPLVYLGGVFYSIDVLPELWRTVSHFNPLLYIINLFRYGMLGVSDVNLSIGYLILVSLTLIMLTVNIVLVRKGVGIKT